MLYYVVAQQRGGHGAKVRIANIVALAALQPPFSLKELTSSYPFLGEKYFTHVAVPHQHSYFAIFSTGKVMSLSAKSRSELEASFSWLRSFLSEFNLTLSDSYEIVNVVAATQVAPSLDLFRLAFLLPRTSYEQPHDLGPHPFHRQINALVYHFAPSPMKPRETALIFATGRAILTGFRSAQEVREAAALLSQLLARIAEAHPEILQRTFHPSHSSPPNRRISRKVKNDRALVHPEKRRTMARL